MALGVSGAEGLKGWPEVGDPERLGELACFVNCPRGGGENVGNVRTVTSWAFQLSPPPPLCAFKSLSPEQVLGDVSLEIEVSRARYVTRMELTIQLS